MAGEWIAMRHDLWDCPQVVRILSASCPQDVRIMSRRCEIIGALFRTWCLFDRFTEEGILVGYTQEMLDAEVGVDGWSVDLQRVGWLIVEDERLIVPDFAAYFGQSAKRRLTDARRKRDDRKTRPQNVRTPADEMRTTEQNRTEQNRKKKTPISPFVAPSVEDVQRYSDEAKLGLDAGHFVDFYTAKAWMVGRNHMKDWRAAARNASRDGWCKVGAGGNGTMTPAEYKADLARRAKRTLDYVTGGPDG